MTRRTMTRFRDMRERPAAPWAVVLAASLALFMATIDMNIVAVALPVLERRLDVGTAASEWVVLGYLLPLLAFALPAGRWLDRVGTRPALVLAVTGFAAASVAAGSAPGISWLVGARVVQGTFGALLLPLVPALAASAVPAESRGRAMSVVATVGGLGAAAGPAVGGLLVQTAGWPWIFYLNVPVSVAVLGVAVTRLPAGRRLTLPGGATLVEALLLGAAACAVLLGLSRVAADGPAWAGVVLFAVLPLLAWWRTDASRPVRALLRTPGVGGPHLGLVAFATTVGSVQFLAPFYLVEVRDAAAAAAGLTVLALPLAMTLAAPVAGVLTDTWSARGTAVVGMVVLVSGVLLTAPLSATWGNVDVAWRLGVVGVGAGLFNPANLTTAMSHAPTTLRATTGATTNLARQLGFAVGPASATAVWLLAGRTDAGLRAAFAVAVVAGLAGLAGTAVPRGYPAAWTRRGVRSQP